MRAHFTTAIRAALTGLLLLGGTMVVSADEASVATLPSDLIATSAAPVFQPASRFKDLTLYGSFAALQAADVVSTFQALKRPGAYEANPIAGGLVDHPAEFIALKAGTTIAVLAAMHRFSKSHPKAAMFVLIGLNSGYASIVESNLRRAAGH